MEVPLNIWIRQIHRWLSIAFTLARHRQHRRHEQQGQPHAWIGLLALSPLILLLLTGLYMFVLPYAAEWRGARRAGG